MHAAGYQFFPLPPGKKAPPPTGWRTNPALTLEQCLTILGQGGNLGIRLRATDLIVDVDYRNGGDHTVLGFDIWNYPMVKTPGGLHIYMSKPESLKIHKNVSAFPGVDFLTAGSYVVSPGSTHPNGGAYKFRVDIFDAN
jgi:hypothetical protein